MPSLSRHDTVFVLRFAEPEDPADAPDNALSPAFLDSVEAALDEVEGSEGPGALVTTGAGKYYSTGLDLGVIGGDPAGLPAYVSRVQRLYARLLRLETPTVAAVNGHAFAGGAMLTLAHDARVMRSDRGFWCLPEVDLNMPLAPGMAAIVQARLTPQVAHEAVLTGQRYPADEALAKAIVDAVAPEAEVVRDAVALAVTQAARGRSTIGQLKQDLYGPALAVMAEGALP